MMLMGVWKVRTSKKSSSIMSQWYLVDGDRSVWEKPVHTKSAEESAAKIDSDSFACLQCGSCKHSDERLLIFVWTASAIFCCMAIMI